MSTPSEVKSGLQAISDLISGSISGRARAKAQLLAARNQLAAIPTQFADVIAEVDGYTPTGAFETLAKDGPSGYQVLSRFQLAATDAKAGDTDKAVAAYDALATDAGVDPILQGLATVQAATLRVDAADYAEMERRLNGLVENNSRWRFSARELLGLSAYQHKDMRAAEEQFSALLADQNTPPNLRERANMMLALIVSSTPAQSSSTTN